MATVKVDGAINHYDLNPVFKNSIGKAMHLYSVEEYGCHQKKLHPFSPAVRILTDATESTVSRKSFPHAKQRERTVSRAPFTQDLSGALSPSIALNKLHLQLRFECFCK